MGIFSMFRSKGQSSNESKDYEKLTDALRDTYRTELKCDPNKEFNKEFERTTNLESTLIEKYGFDAIKLIFEERHSKNLFQLGEFPSDCPWVTFNDSDLKQFADRNFDPIKKKIPLLIKAIRERCRFIYAEKLEDTWNLHYLLDMKLHDGRKYYKVFTGGSPNKNPESNENLKKYDWTIPNDLKFFYSIHDGFGEIYDANYIMSSKDIKVMGEMMNPICEELNTQPENYSFENLLEFFPDGAGNAQCFLRSARGNNTTVDWDHEVWEISDETSFYDFINERMSEIDEE